MPSSVPNTKDTVVDIHAKAFSGPGMIQTEMKKGYVMHGPEGIALRMVSD